MFFKSFAPLHIFDFKENSNWKFGEWDERRDEKSEKKTQTRFKYSLSQTTSKRNESSYGRRRRLGTPVNAQLRGIFKQLVYSPRKKSITYPALRFSLVCIMHDSRSPTSFLGKGVWPGLSRTSRNNVVAYHFFLIRGAFDLPLIVNSMLTALKKEMRGKMKEVLRKLNEAILKLRFR